jgi:hypothetical protein
MIVSSKVDLVYWTGRVCRDCHEALTTGDAGGARLISKRAAIEEGHRGCRRFRDSGQLSGEPMPAPSMTAAAASHIRSAATSVVGQIRKSGRATG